MHESSEILHRNAHSRGILFNFKFLFLFFLHKCALQFISNIRTNNCTEERCHKKALQQSHNTDNEDRLCFIHNKPQKNSLQWPPICLDQKTSEVNDLGNSFQLIICLLLQLTKLKQDDFINRKMKVSRHIVVNS